MKLQLCGCAIVFAAASAFAAPRHKPAPSVVASSATLYDFEGAKLGMSIDSWRSLTPQKPSWDINEKDGPVIPVCSSDTMSHENWDQWPSVDRNEMKVGIVTCEYLRRRNDRLQEVVLPLGQGGTDDVKYYFYQNKLFRIAINASDNLAENVMAALTRKWGQPTSRHAVAAKNETGGPVTQLVDRWSNPAAFITVESPFGLTDNMRIMFQSSIGREVERQVKAAEAATSAI